MSSSECAWCSQDIDDGGILFKGLVFCSEDCRSEYEEDTLTADDIDFTKLEEDSLLEGRIVEEDLDLDDDLPDYEEEEY